jgi:hypothetical protein
MSSGDDLGNIRVEFFRLQPDAASGRRPFIGISHPSRTFVPLGIFPRLMHLLQQEKARRRSTL